MNSTNKSLKLAFIWPKWVGKDYILSKLTEKDSSWKLKIEAYWNIPEEVKILLNTYERVSVWDYLKSLSTDEEMTNTAVGMDVPFNYNYLKQDINKVFSEISNFPNVTELILEALDNTWNIKFLSESKNEQRSIVFKKLLDVINGKKDIDKDNLKKIELMLMEVFKNIPELSTRHHLQIFGDVIKKATANPFFITENLCKGLDDNKNYVSTDTRTLTDLIDLTWNGFFVIKLNNISILNKILGTNLTDVNFQFGQKPNVNNMNASTQHFSETDLSLNVFNVGYNVSTDWSFTDKNWIKRLNDDEIYKSFIEVFNKIWEELRSPQNQNNKIKEILKLKERVKKNKELFKTQDNYIKEYSECMRDMNTPKMDLSRSIKLFKDYIDYANIRDEILEEYENHYNVFDHTFRTKYSIKDLQRWLKRLTWMKWSIK